MKSTGERPVRDSTPASLVALHDAGYREVISRLPTGSVLDIGCGVGDETARLASTDRRIFGIDYDPETAAQARSNRVSTVCGDGSRLPFADGSMDAVCSSHIIEHFVDPEPHVREAGRVLTDDGIFLVLTPNEPADFENPYHVHLFRPQGLHDLLERHFSTVEVIGLDGDESVHEDFDRRRRLGRRILRLDPFGLRRLLPRKAYVALHALGRRLLYPIANRPDSATPEIGQDNFHLTSDIDDRTLVLFAIATGPKR